MATKKQTFQEELTPRLPTAPDTAPLVAAGVKEGEAAVARARGAASSQLTDVGIATTIGKQAMEAGKGYLESGLESEIKKTVDSYDARVQTDSAQLAIDLFNDPVLPSSPAEVENAKAQIRKYKDALDQGIMTREQALLSIDKSVKDFSNRMPGWASDFRKVAYTLTGVEHLGRYREHTLLTQQSAAERYREKQADFFVKMQQKAIENFVQTYGRLPEGGWNGVDMTLFRDQLQIKTNADNLKNQLSIRDSTVAQNEPVAINYVSQRLADGLITINTKLQGLVYAKDPKTGKPYGAENKILIRQSILADIGTFFETMKSEVLSFNSNQLSQSAREQQLNRLNTQQEQLTTALKNQDSFDDFRKNMELRSTQAKDVLNKWSIANPHLEILRQSGMATPEIARVWIDFQTDPRKQAEFRRRYGGALDDYFKSLSTGGQAAMNSHASNMNLASVSEEHLNALKLTNDGAYRAAMHTLRDHIKDISIRGWGETQETQELRKMRFADNIRVFGSQVNFQDESAVKSWVQLMSDPRVVQKVQELPQQLAALASNSVTTKAREVVENPEFGAMKRLQDLQRSLGDSVLLGTVSSATHGPFDLVYDEASGQIKVQQYVRSPGIGGAPAQTRPRQEFTIERDAKGTPKGLVGKPVLTDGGSLGFGEVKELVSLTNRALSVLSNFGQQDRNLVKDTVQKFNAGYFGMSPEDREKALKAGAEVVSKSKGEFKPDSKALSSIQNASSKQVQKQLGGVSPEEQEIRDARAGEERAREFNNDPVVIESHLKELATELARKDLNSTARAILQREYALWTKAKEAISGQAGN